MTNEGRTNPIYLDHNVSTPIAPEVVAEMEHYLKESFGIHRDRECVGQRKGHGI